MDHQSQPVVDWLGGISSSERIRSLCSQDFNWLILPDLHPNWAKKLKDFALVGNYIVRSNAICREMLTNSVKKHLNTDGNNHQPKAGTQQELWDGILFDPPGVARLLASQGTTQLWICDESLGHHVI